MHGWLGFLSHIFLVSSVTGARAIENLKSMDA